jgi:hypothetical protein
MVTLKLDIRRLETQKGWQASWYLDDELVAQPFLVVGSTTDAVVELGERFLGLFEQSVRPLVDARDLRNIGRRLFEVWIQPLWPMLRQRLSAGLHQLLIRTRESELLNLPWELVELDSGLPLGCDPRWSLRRTPRERLLITERPLEPGPLRILFMTAAPVDQIQLDYEREEDALLRVTARLPEGAVVRFAETGGLDELASLVPE